MGATAVLHLLIVVPDVRLFQLLKTKMRIVQPPYFPAKVELHVIVEDKKDPLKDLDWRIRQAAVELGLQTAEDMNLTHPDQVTLGWVEQQET